MTTATRSGVQLEIEHQQPVGVSGTHFAFVVSTLLCAFEGFQMIFCRAFPSAVATLRAKCMSLLIDIVNIFAHTCMTYARETYFTLLCIPMRANMNYEGMKARPGHSRSKLPLSC